MEDVRLNEDEECCETDLRSVAFTVMLLAGSIVMIVVGLIPLLAMIF